MKEKLEEVHPRMQKRFMKQKTYEELVEENEKLKNKLLLLEKLNQDAFARLLEATNAISYYEQAMKVERYNAWK